jgi:predicted DNA-binding transcriptional regulator YafY
MWVSQYIQERQWSTGQIIKVLDTGSLELTLTTRSSIEIFQWLLSFGRKAEVLSPAWMRENLKNEAQAVVAKYEKE